MQYSEQRVGTVLVVGLSGRLDMEAEYELLQSFDTWMDSKPNFVFDCTDLEFIDSSGLGILLRILKRTISAGKDIRLAAVNDQVRMLFEITRADQIFQLFSTTEEAIDSFSEN
ncbi:STAS domain-containing protein [Desulfogranum japonicum]|uniref:STAS domain-containing protein n=1 Tax=Desulfogranum japonicum TaxID=231447 RepID=UPI00040C50F7|nr:STAS domain-containing protein [Desulfogranum japonicum]